jgi:hypothetical protein
VNATSHSWRLIRAKLAAGGITDPLRHFPTMHGLLDIVESMALEGKAEEGPDAIQRFYFELYKPEPDKVAEQFKPEDTEDSFAAFAAMAGGMH